MDSSPSSVTYVTMDDFGNATPAQDAIRGVPVHTGTPVKYGPFEEDGNCVDEWNLRETRVQVSYLHPDVIETRGSDHAEEPKDEKDVDCANQEADAERANREIEAQRRQLEFRESELSFLAVRTTCAKLLPVDDCGRRVEYSAINESGSEAVAYVPVDPAGNVIALTSGGGPCRPEMLTDDELDYGIAPDSTSTPLKPPEEEYIRELYALHAQIPHSGKYDGVFEDGVRFYQQLPPQPPQPLLQQQPPVIPPFSADGISSNISRDGSYLACVRQPSSDAFDQYSPSCDDAPLLPPPNFLSETSTAVAASSLTHSSLPRPPINSQQYQQPQQPFQRPEQQQQQPPPQQLQRSHPSTPLNDSPSLLAFQSTPSESSSLPPSLPQLYSRTPATPRSFSNHGPFPTPPQPQRVPFTPSQLDSATAAMPPTNPTASIPTSGDAPESAAAPLALAESFADMDLDSLRGTPVHQLSSASPLPFGDPPGCGRGVANGDRLRSSSSIASAVITATPMSPISVTSSYAGAATHSPTPIFNAGAALHSPDTQAPDDDSIASSVHSLASDQQPHHHHHHPRQRMPKIGGVPPPANGGATSMNGRASAVGRRGGATPPNTLVVAPSNGQPGNQDDDLYRDPTLPEVIDYLAIEDDKLKANAGAYLQHLMFKNEVVKRQVRLDGGIPPLLVCLDAEEGVVRKNACKALKNLSHKDRHKESSVESEDANKVAIFDAGGVSVLAARLKSAPDPQERGLVAAVLWNLSACEEIKPHLLEDGEMLCNVIDGIILSRARYNRDVSFNANPILGLPFPEDLKNSTGILRNLSSAGGRDPETRSRLRRWPGLVDSLVRVVKSAVDDSVDAGDTADPGANLHFTPINNKVVENAACTLRNLSYRIQEIRDGADYDEERFVGKEGDETKNQSLTDTLSDEGRDNSTLMTTSISTTSSKMSFIRSLDATMERRKRKRDETYSSSKTHPVGAELLWHQDTIGLYVSLLESCVNATTLAAAGGAIQNLCACAWRPSAEIRSLVRRKMGLPMIVDLLQLQDERAVCAMAWALRNLIIQDATNRQLVGKYGVANLAALLPEENATTTTNNPRGSLKRSKEHLEDTVYAALSTLADVLHKNPNAAQQFLEKKGVDKTIWLTRSRGVYTERTLKMAALLLRRVWQIKSLQKAYKKRGFAQRDFHVTKLEVARQPEADAFQRRNDTLIRQNKPTESDRGGGGGARLRRRRGERDRDDSALQEETPV